jgi:hypothetical protein
MGERGAPFLVVKKRGLRMNTVISWHSMGLSSLYAYFFSSPQGLSQLEAEKRRSANQDAEAEYRRLFIKTLMGLPALYLAAIVFFSILCFFNEYLFAGGLGLLAATLYAVVFAKEARQRVNWAIMLNNLNREKITVYRDGQPKLHLPEDLVLGDVLELQPGKMVPATVRLIDDKNLYVALSSKDEPQEKKAINFTKEETVVTKVLFPNEKGWNETNPVNIVPAGSWVSKGQGKGIVIDIPDENKSAWLMDQFHIEPLFSLNDFAWKPLAILSIAVLFMFMLIEMNLDGKSHGFFATLLASCGFLVLLFPITIILLQVHRANLQVHDLLRKQIILRNSNVFNNLANTSMVVAEAEYLFKEEIKDISDIIAQGLQLIIITKKSKEWLTDELAAHGVLGKTIIDHQQFANLSDRQIEERLKSVAYFAELSSADMKRLFQVIKAEDKPFVLIGERSEDETFIPAQLRLLFANQTTSSVTRNATDILVLSNNIKEFLCALLAFQKQKDKVMQNESVLRTAHHFCAAGVILAFIIGGGVGESVALSLLVLLGLWNTFSI